MIKFISGLLVGVLFTFVAIHFASDSPGKRSLSVSNSTNTLEHAKPIASNTTTAVNSQANHSAAKLRAGGTKSASDLVENAIPLTEAHQLAIAKSREQEPAQITLHGQHDNIEAEPRDEYGVRATSRMIDCSARTAKFTCRVTKYC